MMYEKPYQGGFGAFLKSPINDLSREIGVYGIPFDCATSYRPGARFAPNAIRQASMMLTDGAHPLTGIDPSKLVTDMGDIPVSSNPAQCVADIAKTLGSSPFIQNGKRIMSMGGDHLVTLGILRALHKVHGPMALVHFDAHSDVWEYAFDEKFGHGTWLRNAVDEGLVIRGNCVSIGVRSPSDMETAEWLNQQQVGRTLSARTAMRFCPANLAAQFETIFYGVPAYMTFDIDALDPAHAPGTGTPEMGGLSSMFALELVEEFLKIGHGSWVGMDVVEVSPPYDHSGITALAAATLLWTFASFKKRHIV